MRSFQWVAICSVVTAMLSGCSSMTQLQGSVSKFDQDTHAAATDEVSFLRAVQTADCDNQFYSNSYNFAVGSTNSLDLSGVCTPTILTDNQIKIRQVLMDAITLYADKMQALSTNNDNKTLDTNSLKLANQIRSLATQHGLSGVPEASAVESSIIELTDMVLDKKRFSDIQHTAKAMAASLAKVVVDIKTENTILAIGISSKTQQLEPELQLVVKSARSQRGPASFFDVIEARRLMQSTDPFGAAPVAATAGAFDHETNPQSVAERLNAALDAVVNANQAIAIASTGGIIASVDDLTARVKAAQTLQAVLNK